MTTRKNSRQTRMRARVAPAGSASAPVEVVAETQGALIKRLRRMADEVELLQTEIAAVEAFVTEPAPAVVETKAPTEAAASALTTVRPGSTWKPTPTPQPWLVARSA